MSDHYMIISQNIFVFVILRWPPRFPFLGIRSLRPALALREGGPMNITEYLIS